MDGVDPLLVHAWLEARSLARQLPPPIAEFGGFRVDTNSENEVRRWVFAAVVPGLAELGRTIRKSRRLLKLCGTADELAGALPQRWTVQGGHWFMQLDGAPAPMQSLPGGYRLATFQDDAMTKVEIRTTGGELAASGYAAETSDAFVYDRIETDPSHRRRGLARAVMTALGSCRRSQRVTQLLMATAEGEKLYSTLSWHKLSPYATAWLPEQA
jgi:GNAT superfamily N-acetyltransferase